MTIPFIASYLTTSSGYCLLNQHRLTDSVWVMDPYMNENRRDSSKWFVASMRKLLAWTELGQAVTRVFDETIHFKGHFLKCFRQISFALKIALSCYHYLVLVSQTFGMEIDSMALVYWATALLCSPTCCSANPKWKNSSKYCKTTFEKPVADPGGRRPGPLTPKLQHTFCAAWHNSI